MKWYRVTHLLVLSLLIVMGLIGSLSLPSSTLARSTQQVSITLKEYSITPDKLSVPANEPVQFTVTNAGTMEHNFTVEKESQGIEKQLFSTNLKPGETRTAEYTFPVAGEWEMYCPLDGHKTLGMKGEIEVAGSEPAGMPRTGMHISVITLSLLLATGVLALAGGLLVRRRSRV